MKKLLGILAFTFVFSFSAFTQPDNGLALENASDAKADIKNVVVSNYWQFSALFMPFFPHRQWINNL